jgi:hypothetical protein
VLWNKGAPAPYIDAVVRAAPALRLEVERIPVDGPDDLMRGFKAAAASGADGLMTLPNGVFFNRRREIVMLAAADKLPAIYPEREYVEAGGLTEEARWRRAPNSILGRRRGGHQWARTRVRFFEGRTRENAGVRKAGRPPKRQATAPARRSVAFRSVAAARSKRC